MPAKPMKPWNDFTAPPKPKILLEPLVPGKYRGTNPEFPGERSASQPPRMFGYIRASTDRQIASPDVQRETIQSYVYHRGWQYEDVLWFVDPAKSGKSHMTDREAGRVMMAALQKGDAIIVARMDRLSRSVGGFGRILDAIEKIGVSIHMCDQPGGVLDPLIPMSKMLMSMLVVFAEYERTLIIGRIREGKAASAREGRVQSSLLPLGYSAVTLPRTKNSYGQPIRMLVPCEKERAMARMATELHSQGLTLRTIADRLNSAGYRNRHGRKWQQCQTQNMIHRGYRLLAKIEELEKNPNAHDPRPEEDFVEVPSVVDI